MLVASAVDELDVGTGDPFETEELPEDFDSNGNGTVSTVSDLLVVAKTPNGKGETVDEVDKLEVMDDEIEAERFDNFGDAAKERGGRGNSGVLDILRR